jgi:hypothetical protein
MAVASSVASPHRHGLPSWLSGLLPVMPSDTRGVSAGVMGDSVAQRAQVIELVVDIAPALARTEHPVEVAAPE